MAYLVTDAQKAALLGSHEMTTRVAAFRGSQSLGDIDVIDVAVSATYGTQGGRDAVLVVDRNLIDAGFLNPLSDQVIIYTGIRGVVEVPIFTGRVDTQNASSDGSVEVPLLSRGTEATRAAFEVPWAVSAPFQSNAEVIKILQNVNPAWAVETTNATTRPIPATLVWEEDRGDALDQIAQGASQIWQPNRTGGFTLFDNPYAIGPSLASGSVVTIRDGVGGATVTVRDARTRDGIFNSVTVVVERLDNSPPIRVTVRDTNPASPTYWGGLFGKQNKVVKNQNPLNQAETVNLALRILRQSLALQRSWRIELPHMPLLDPGDVFTLWYRDEVTAQVVESIYYAGQAQDKTVISSRELTLAEATVI